MTVNFVHLSYIGCIRRLLNSCIFFLQELHLLRINAHFFLNIDAILSLFFRFTHQCTFCHITAKLAEAENLIGVAQRQNNLVTGITKLCANLKQKMQTLSVLIAHANTIPIALNAKCGSAKCT